MLKHVALFPDLTYGQTPNEQLLEGRTDRRLTERRNGSQTTDTSEVDISTFNWRTDGQQWMNGQTDE